MRLLPSLSGLAFLFQSVSGFMDLANQAVIGQSTPLFWNQPVGTTIALQLVCETCSNDATSSLPPIDTQGSLSGIDTIVFSSTLQPGTYHILAQTGQTSDTSQTHSFQLLSGDGTTPSNPTNAANSQTSKASTGAGQGSTTTKASGTGTAVPGQPATSTSSSSLVGSSSSSDSGKVAAESHSSASVTLSTLPGGTIVTISGPSSLTTTSTSTSSPNASTTSNSGSHHLPAGALGGIIAGMLILFALLALILVCWLRRRSQRSKGFTSNPFSDKLVDHPPRSSSLIEPVILPQDSTQSSITAIDEKLPIPTTEVTRNQDTSSPLESPSPLSSALVSSPIASSAPSQGVSSTSDATINVTRSNATIDAMAAEMERMKTEIDWLKNQHMVEQLPPAYS